LPAQGWPRGVCYGAARMEREGSIPERVAGGLPNILWCDPGLVTAEIGPVFLGLWRGTVTRERFEAQRLGVESVIRANPQGIALLVVIEPSSPVPDSDIRRASGNMLALQRPYIRYAACVMEGDGVRATLVRAALMAMRNLVTGKLPTGYLATVPEGVKRLAEHVPVASEETLVRSVEAARSYLDAVSGVSANGVAGASSR
jgi:hypothetical protein